MNLRFYIDPETGYPHIYRHGVGEYEVEDVLRDDWTVDLPSRRGAAPAWRWGKLAADAICW